MDKIEINEEEELALILRQIERLSRASDALEVGIISLERGRRTRESVRRTLDYARPVSTSSNEYVKAWIDFHRAIKRLDRIIAEEVVLKLG